MSLTAEEDLCLHCFSQLFNFRSCKHPCQKKCGDPCEAGDCKLCEAEAQKELEAARKAAKLRINEVRKKILEGACFKVTELAATGPTAARYLSVKDKVEKYVLPMHNWFPTVTKIEEIFNPDLLLKFEQAKLKCFGHHTDLKFHGTGDAGNENIPKNGFRLPGPPPPGKQGGMYGQGIYFATDSSKSAQAIYTKGSNKLLLCDVLLGKSKTVLRAAPDLNYETLRKEKFDSVFAPRGTKGTGGVANDEFVIFDPDQALPKYIIHYKVSSGLSTSSLVSPGSLSAQGVQVHTVMASRNVDMNDPLKVHYDRAFAKFHEASSKGYYLFKIIYRHALGYAFFVSSLQFFPCYLPDLVGKF